VSASVGAILVAAGSGLRFAQPGEAKPKQFVDLQGRPLFLWPLSVLSKHSRVNRIVVVTLSEKVPLVEQIVSDQGIADKVTVTAGGITRQESVWFGLQALYSYMSPESIVLVHDAARPFLTSATIDATILGAESSGACTVAIPASDTIKRVNNGVIETTLDRSELVYVQTPQAGRFDWLCDAHKRAREKGLATTDDAALLEATGHRVTVVPGSSNNLKVTNKEDLMLAEALAQILF
jgi:2-C-methyl-D-erythritol 4-phosphate cytidylyltransferase